MKKLLACSLLSFLSITSAFATITAHPKYPYVTSIPNALSLVKAKSNDYSTMIVVSNFDQAEGNITVSFTNQSPCDTPIVVVPRQSAISTNSNPPYAVCIADSSGKVFFSYSVDPYSVISVYSDDQYSYQPE